MVGLKLKTGAGGLESLSALGKLIVGVVFVAMAAGVYFMVFYTDVESQIDGQREAIEGKKVELARADEAKAVFNKDLAEKSQREGILRKQKKILPDEAETPAFLSTIQNTATISGVMLSSWTPLDEQGEDFYAKVPMQLKLRGKFHQVAKFFNHIGQADRIINMENITIQLAADEASKKPTDPALIPPGTEETVTIDVECLATAFRALKGDEGKKKRKRGGQP